jgi:hypothetical protein
MQERVHTQSAALPAPCWAKRRVLDWRCTILHGLNVSLRDNLLLIKRRHWMRDTWYTHRKQWSIWSHIKINTHRKQWSIWAHIWINTHRRQWNKQAHILDTVPLTGEGGWGEACPDTSGSLCSQNWQWNPWEDLGERGPWLRNIEDSYTEGGGGARARRRHAMLRQWAVTSTCALQLGSSKHGCY